MILLNLLPQLQKRRLQREIFLRALFVLSLFVTVWITTFFLLVVQSWIFISIQNNAIAERVKVEEGAESAQKLIAFEEATVGANKTIAKIIKASENPRHDPVIIFNVLSSLMPTGTSLVTLDLNSDTKILTINGIASTRDDVLLFEANLRSRTDIFSEVDSPIDNILTPRNVKFSFSITLQ